MGQIQYREALEKLLKICSQQEKCTYDIRMKLKSWNVNPDDSEKILKILIKERYIDDSRYSKLFAKEKFRLNKWGKIKIAFALKQKKISSELIESALAEIDSGDYIEVLSSEISRKRKNIKAKNQYDLRGKLFRFARSKGFENELIYRIIDQCLTEGDK